MFPKPEGVERSFSETLFLELAPIKHNNSRSVSFSFPPDVVPGSQRAHVALVGTSTICPPCCASGSSIWELFMCTFSQLGMCNMCSHFSFVFSWWARGTCAPSSALSWKHLVLNVEKWKRWTSNGCVYGGQILNSCQAVWLGSIQVEGCWAFVMVDRQASGFSSVGAKFVVSVLFVVASFITHQANVLDGVSSVTSWMWWCLIVSSVLPRSNWNHCCDFLSGHLKDIAPFTYRSAVSPTTSGCYTLTHFQLRDVCERRGRYIYLLIQ